MNSGAMFKAIFLQLTTILVYKANGAWLCFKPPKKLTPTIILRILRRQSKYLPRLNPFIIKAFANF